jgi:signal transduction histidine kinase
VLVTRSVTIGTKPADRAYELRVGRLVVFWVAGALLALFAAGLLVWGLNAPALPGTGFDTARARAVLAGWGLPAGWYVGFLMSLELLLVVVSATAAYLVLRGVLSWFRLYLAFMLVLFATAGGAVPMVLAGRYPGVTHGAELVQGLAWIGLFPLAYLFPDGRFVPAWSRWLALAWPAWLLVAIAVPGADDSAVAAAVLLLLFASAVVAQVHRYWKISGPVERLQTRWVIFAVGLRVGYGVLIAATPVGRWQDETSPRGLFTYAATMLVSYVIAAALPAAVAIAIVRHRLFDIDTVISRTLVWGILTGFVLGTYALVVGGIGELWRGAPLPLVATALVAVAFSPVRERVQRRVNRLVYGERHDPYAVLSSLGRQLAGAVAPEAVAPAIVDAVARALRAPYVAIVMDDAGSTVASMGRLAAYVSEIPLSYQGQALGRIVVGADLSESDRGLLADLADQCGAALYAARESARTRRLAVDLQYTRSQLVVAREEERRRIRRDLHDSLGPALSGQSLTIDTARALLDSDPAATDRLLRDLKSQTQETLAEVRRLARQLRPPVLDELGLATALRDVPARYPIVSVDIPDLPTLPAAVEVAAYRITHEALTNVVRHARAHHARLSLSVEDGTLVLEVADDGCGIAPDVPAGVGTSSMRERAEELGGTLRITGGDGGGTRLVARLPLGVLPEGERPT